MIKVIIGDAFINIPGDENSYRVKAYYKGMKMKKGYAYMKNDIVYIYRGKLKDAADPSIPGVYKISAGNHKFVKPSKSERDIYSVDNVRSLAIDDIMKELTKNKERFQQPEDVEIINDNSELFIPTISVDDDFLKVLIKKAIIAKQMNINSYKNKFRDEYSLNNMKSGLKKKTKMTVSKFRDWCEILGLSFEMVVYDSGKDPFNPLNENIKISSDDLLPEDDEI
jgi:hypothetical protein